MLLLLSVSVSNAEDIYISAQAGIDAISEEIEVRQQFYLEEL